VSNEPVLASVLVYGTLRPGQSNYYNFLEGRTERERTVTLKGFRMYAGMGFPYVIQTDTDETIVADLIDLKADSYDETVRGLDMLEGYRGPGLNNHYDRVLVTVEDVDGTTVQAWIYVAHKSIHQQIAENLPALAGGDWSKLEQEREEAFQARLAEQEEEENRRQRDMNFHWANESDQMMALEEEDDADLELEREIARERNREVRFWHRRHMSGGVV
jgi:gamma-glutamylcyclotransferase (GGCT)/AIG2-like uncharacterized protein YtfP